MDVSQLPGMVSVGTLLAFTTVAISILILRYVPPDVVPLPSSLQETIDSVSFRYSNEEKILEISKNVAEETIDYPLIVKQNNLDKLKEQKRNYATWSIASVCIGVLILTSSASVASLPKLYKRCPHPDYNQRLKLSKQLGLKSSQIKFWFQNKRTHMKAQQDRAENLMLKAENENLKNDNNRLQAVIRNAKCPNCCRSAILGEMSDEQRLRLENARLKDQVLWLPVKPYMKNIGHYS